MTERIEHKQVKQGFSALGYCAHCDKYRPIDMGNLCKECAYNELAEARIRALAVRS